MGSGHWLHRWESKSGDPENRQEDLRRRGGEMACLVRGVPCNSQNTILNRHDTWDILELGLCSSFLVVAVLALVSFFWNQGRQAIYWENIKQPLTATSKSLSTYCLSFTDSPTALHQWHPCSWWSCILAAVICSFGSLPLTVSHLFCCNFKAIIAALKKKGGKSWNDW